MHLERVASATAAVGSAVGPRALLAALRDLETALADVDAALDLDDQPLSERTPHDESAIDLRATRATVEQVEPHLERAGERIDHFRSVISGH